MNYPECEVCGESAEHEHEAVVIREGASLRTADELLECFVSDAIDLGAELSPYGAESLRLAREALENDRSARSGVAWIESDDVREGLADLAWQVEADLSDYCVVWEDGYVIYRYEPMSDGDEPDEPDDGFLPFGTGGLRDEIRYAESFSDE